MRLLDDETIIGRMVDSRYEIEELVARGGMASVFRAIDHRLDRIVAVKIMEPRSGAHTDPQSFTREAKLAARLNHRGIVAIYDHGTDGDLNYLVMEYVPGHTLRDVLREEAPMAPRRALAHLEPVLVALSAAHEAGLIHRDIKPENVLIGTNGDVKVADFGLARQATVDHRTNSVLIGTVSYLAPEVITHDGVDARADIYACGAILYEMLTGRKPHEADSPLAVAHKHVNEDIVPPSVFMPNLPPYVDALTLRALARDRAQRSPDARTFLHQVRLVQTALANRLPDDEDLTRDLLPGAGPTPAQPPRMVSPLTDSEATELVSATTHADVNDLTQPVTSVGTPEATTAWPSPDAGAPAQPAVRQRRRRRGPILLVLAIIALIVTALVGWWIGVGRYDMTPSLVDLPREEAVKVAEAAGFEVDFAADIYSEDIGKDTVISSDPEAGARILPGETIMLTVSKGQERYEIPKLKGKTVDDSETILGSLNLQVGTVTKDWHDSVKDGEVIRSSSHKVGDLVKRDTAVDLVISKGPAPVELANHTGSNADAAAAKLKDQGLTVQTQTQYHDDVPAGQVISQSPGAGTVHRNDTVTLVVSRGPDKVRIPDFIGMSQAEAKKAAKEAGLKLNISSNPFAGDRATVRYQSPSDGRSVKRGSTITIFLN